MPRVVFLGSVTSFATPPSATMALTARPRLGSQVSAIPLKIGFVIPVTVLSTKWLAPSKEGAGGRVLHLLR